MAEIPSWTRNVERSGGYWSDGRWYDLHADRRLPLVQPMRDELVLALPPLPEGTLVGDVACGTGQASDALLAAYPGVRVVLLDQDPDLLDRACTKVEGRAANAQRRVVKIAADGSPLPGGPYAVLVASLALHAIVGHDGDRTEAETRYTRLLRGCHRSLAPGGHLLVGDHVGTLPLFAQLKAMERAGFTDVDCAWRQDDFFVAGGRVGD